MRLLVCAAVVAFCLKVILALFTIGTNDAPTWEQDLLKLRVKGFAALYREGVQYSSPPRDPYPRQNFIHPPAVITGLRVLGKLQDLSGLPFRFWMRLGCAFADIGTLCVLWMMFGNRKSLLLQALSPISVLVSGFHMNTDPIMIFFVVLAVFLAERGSFGWSGVAIGIALSIKLVPMIFVPAILCYLPHARSRAKWMGAAALTWITLSMPYIAQEPFLIFKTMFGYDSSMGIWGLYWLSSLLKSTALQPLYEAYQPAAKWMALMAVALLPVIFCLLKVRPSLFVQAGMVVFLFLFLSPGFGLQYLSWTVPWTVALPSGAMVLYHGLVGAFLAFGYIAASGGIHRNAYADVFNFDLTTRILIRLVFWTAIGAVLWLYARCVTATRAGCVEGVGQ